MRSVARRVFVAIVLVVLGWWCWRAGSLERQLADGDRTLATLRYAQPLEAYSRIEDALAVLDRLPGAEPDTLQATRVQAATARYWLADYVNLLPPRDDQGQPVWREPDRLFVAANAAFRASVLAGGEPAVLGDRFERVGVAYAEVLRAGGTHDDAAYNFEVVSRLRHALAGNGESALYTAVRALADAATTGTADAQDLPGGGTLHGRPGAPLNLSMEQFKVHVPLRPTERLDWSEGAGAGDRKDRKG